jgi:hypothetical protein
MMPARSPLPRLTLTARLTALYTLVSATVLLGLGGLTVLAVVLAIHVGNMEDGLENRRIRCHEIPRRTGMKS